MRCPKCGYISFDRQRSCGKCSNDLTAVAEQLKGTVGNVAAPFFLGGVLGRQKTSEVEPGPALYEEEEAVALDDLEAEAPPVGEEELDFAGSPLDEADLEDQPLPSLGLGNIDFSDLVPPQEEEQEPKPPMEIELPSSEPDDIMNLGGQESPLGGLEEEVAEPQANAENEDIIDLSSLMDFGEAPSKPSATEESEDLFELSLGDEPEDLHLSLEDDDKAPASGDMTKKPASAAADIPDLGLTLEDDDK